MKTRRQLYANLLKASRLISRHSLHHARDSFANDGKCALLNMDYFMATSDEYYEVDGASRTVIDLGETWMHMCPFRFTDLDKISWMFVSHVRRPSRDRY
ncbi:hypothetical protein BKH18_08765 [Actinomyces oris]|nr:hypothetical protein BKH18_08765 [Actinomyces oris]